MDKIMTIPLTKGKVAVVSAVDYPELSKYSWCVSHSGRGKFYACGSQKMNNGKFKLIRMHRFIMGELPRGVGVDHIDGDSLNNRRENLRLASQSQNSANRAPKKYQFKGVYPVGKKFLAQANKKYLGHFDTPELAAAAYNEAALAKWGEFARLNIIPSTQEIPANV